MTPHQLSLRNRLLAVEPPPEPVRDRYHREIQAMLVKQLSLPGRMVLIIVTLVSIVMAGLFVFLLTTEPQLPWPARTGFVLGLLFSLGWIVQLMRILREGKLVVRRDGRRIAQMVWVFTVAMTTLFLIAGMSTLGTGKELLGLMLIAQSLVFLIGAAVYWLNFRIEESEISLKERLLQLEMRLAERDHGET